MSTLIKYVDKNSFGGYTYEYKVANYYRIRIKATGNGIFIVSIQEPNWLWFKTLLEYTEEAPYAGEVILGSVDRLDQCTQYKKNGRLVDGAVESIKYDLGLSIFGIS